MLSSGLSGVTLANLAARDTGLASTGSLAGELRPFP